MSLALSYAGGVYDRTQPLQTGEIRPEGVQVNFLALPLQAVFSRMLQAREFDASEMSLASYVIAHERGEPDLMAIPVFPSRHFRLGCVYVREDSPLASLAELRGRRVGSPQYQMTAAVWVRGLLGEYYDVPIQSVRWVTEVEERLRIALPPDVSLERHPGPGGLEKALLRGEIDALMATVLPRALGRGIRRLLRDSRQAETELFARSGLFPIMHTVVVRGELVRQHPWLARSLYDAFTRAKQHALDAMRDSGVVRHTLPWLLEELEATRRLLGEDFWPYGVARNRATIATLVRYLAQQGLIRTPVEPEALFAETLRET